MVLIQYPQEICDTEMIKKIMTLENTAWPKSTDDEDFPSAPNTYVTSFVAYGLSEVVTHPDYQNQGIASKTIKNAAQFIIAQHPDISIFTCAQNRVSFYTRCGWKAVQGACFVGGTKEKPFRSDSLNLVTMMMFISPKGKRHQADFENTDIIFELGENQLW